MARRAATHLLLALFDTRPQQQQSPAAAALGFLASSFPTSSQSSLPFVLPWPSTARRRHHRGSENASPPHRAVSTSAATSAAAPPPPPPPPPPATLKAALRLLYMRTHPDVMGRHARPSERDRNERSLKLLSEYLAAARCLRGGGGGGGGGDDDSDDELARSAPPPSTHTLPFRFVFHVPGAPPGLEEEDQGQKDEQERAEALPEPLIKVELTLPPPERGRGARGALSPLARRALRRLLVACGVPEPAPDAPDDERRGRGGGGGDADADGDATVTAAGLEPGQGLADWLPLAAEAARRGSGSGGGSPILAAPPVADAAVRVANLRGALRLSRGAAVGFSPDLRRALPARGQAALLLALVRVLAREEAAAAAAEEEEADTAAASTVDLRGLQVTFGGPGTCSGVDGAGTVWLDASEAAAIEASVRHGEWEEQRRRRQPSAAAAAAAAAAPPATRAQLEAADEATEAWADLLAGLDASHARALRAAADSLRALEASVARAMGVSAVVPGAGVAFGGGGAGEHGGGGGGGTGGGGSINPSYRSFLERLAAHASSAGPVQAPVSDVPLVVVAAGAAGDDEQEDEDGGGGTSSSSSNGGGGGGAAAAVTVPLAATPLQAYAFLASRGPAAADRRRRAQRERADRADRDERARRALGLRRLLRDPLLPADRADRGVRALLRLRDDAAGGGAQLACLLEGMSVRVSDACRLPGTEGTDGSSDVVDVAWDARP